MFLDKKYIYYILKSYIFFIRKLEACFPKEQILPAAPENGRDAEHVGAFREKTAVISRFFTHSARRDLEMPGISVKEI